MLHDSGLASIDADRLHACCKRKVRPLTPAARHKLRRLANALSPDDLRALGVEVGMPQAHSRQLPGLVDALVADHHDALLDRIELRINEAARAAADP